MLSSSRINRRIDGSAMSSCALAQARSAAATSRALSWVSQVKPSPSVCQTTWSPNFSIAVRSPLCQAPLPNCTTPTRNPRPTARSKSPKAAVDFPLPLPVWTMSSPFSMVFEATSASCAALRFSILALWRASSSVLSGILGTMAAVRISSLLQGQRQSCGEEYDMIGNGRHSRVETALRIAELAREAVVGDDAEPDLVGDGDQRTLGFAKCGEELLGLGLERPARELDVAQPERQAVDQHRAAARAVVHDCLRKFKR